MPNKNNECYCIDIDLIAMKVIDWGETNTANLTGVTDDPNVHRVFLNSPGLKKYSN